RLGNRRLAAGPALEARGRYRRTLPPDSGGAASASSSPVGSRDAVGSPTLPREQGLDGGGRRRLARARRAGARAPPLQARGHAYVLGTAFGGPRDRGGG